MRGVPIADAPLDRPDGCRVRDGLVGEPEDTAAIDPGSGERAAHPLQRRAEDRRQIDARALNPTGRAGAAPGPAAIAAPGAVELNRMVLVDGAPIDGDGATRVRPTQREEHKHSQRPHLDLAHLIGSPSPHIPSPHLRPLFHANSLYCSP